MHAAEAAIDDSTAQQIAGAAATIAVAVWNVIRQAALVSWQLDRKRVPRPILYKVEPPNMEIFSADGARMVGVVSLRPSSSTCRFSRVLGATAAWHADCTLPAAAELT
jgi:hypothetical protein